MHPGIAPVMFDGVQALFVLELLFSFQQFLRSSFRGAARESEEMRKSSARKVMNDRSLLILWGETVSA